MVKTADYADFLARNNTPQLRTEALLSILSPDTKAVTLWAMEPHVFYTRTKLYEQVLSFANADKLPLTLWAVWVYCNGNGGYEGSLKSIGTAVQCTTASRPTAYAKTDAGRDFGDPTAALGISFVNELIESGKDTPRALLRILDDIVKPDGTSFRRGFLVYKIIELLANNPDPDRGFSRYEVARRLELNEMAISSALNSLGESEMIDYHSPQRDVDGKRAKGWAKYVAKSRLDYETCFNAVKVHYSDPHISGVLRQIVDYVNNHPGEEVNNYTLGDTLGISKNSANWILLSLRAEGYMTSEFKGRLRSEAKANEWTHLLWEKLLKVVGRVAETADPTIKGFRDKLEKYASNPELLIEHIKAVLDVYSDERKHTGSAVDTRVRNALLEILNSANGEPIKLSELAEKVKDLRGKRGPITRVTIRTHLDALLETSKIIKTDRGMYAAKVNRR
jgi:Mn-dependent DtxR family transcriptional regulator